MTQGKRIPTDMSADQRGIDMDDLASRDPGGDTGLNGSFEDPAKAISLPTLMNARQGRVIGQRFRKAIADESADREIDCRLSH